MTPTTAAGCRIPFSIYEEVVTTDDPADHPAAQLSIYPNPATDAFTVRLPASLRPQATVTLRLYDVRGRVVYRQNHASEFITVPVGQLAAGLYWASVETPQGVARGKVVVE